MNRGELLEKCRELVMEICFLESRMDLLDGCEGGPAGIQSNWPDGMPSGTNDPIAAMLQRVDVNEALDKLDWKSGLLRELLEKLDISYHGTVFAG